MSKKSLILLPFAVIIFLGLTPELAELRKVNPFNLQLPLIRRVVFVLLGLFGPCVLLLALIRLYRKRISSLTGTTLIFFVLTFGIVSSILLAAGAGAGSGNGILHGFALTFALTGMVAFMVEDPMRYWGGNLSLVMLTLAFFASVYSLLGVPMAMSQARELANGNSYCIAARPANSYPLTSIPDLRNFSVDVSLGPDLSGSVDLYPNHILLIENGAQREFYYWSPREMSFLEVTPEFPANGRLGRVCIPRPNYLSGLRLF